MIAFCLALIIAVLYACFEYSAQKSLHSSPTCSPSLAFSKSPEKWLSLFSQRQKRQTDKPPQEKITQPPKICLMLKPKKGRYFDGALLKEAFSYLQLSQGPEGFVHKRYGLDILYSICHLYHPGTLSYHQLAASFYAGLLFVFSPTSKEKAQQEFAVMIKDFNKMAIWLSADRLDENAEPLTARNLEYIEQLVS